MKLSVQIAPAVRQFLCLMLLAGCGGGGGGTTGPETITITVAPSTVPITGLNIPATLVATIVGRLGTPITNLTVEWTSDNPAVVTVSGSGNTATLTSRAAGSAVVRASARGTSGSATVNVTARVLSVSINPKTFTLGKNQTRQLAAQVSADPGVATEVDWSTLDQTRATVSNAGLVTAVAGGTARIVARSRFNTAIADT